MRVYILREFVLATHKVNNANVKKRIHAIVVYGFNSALLGILGFLYSNPSDGKEWLYETIFAYTEADKTTRLSFHGEYFRSKSINYTEIHGDHYRIPIVTASLGLGDIGEVWLQYPIHQRVDDNSQGTSVSGGGDPTFFTKVRFVQEGARMPALALSYGVKEPAANPPMGSDETDFFLIASASKLLKSISLHGNFGVGILGDPQENQSQNHSLILRFLITHQRNSNWIIGSEIDTNTRLSDTWYDFTTATGDPSNRASVGLTVNYLLSGKDRLGMKIATGLISQSESLSLYIGYEHLFKGISKN